jgi:hypothetical protein
MKIGNRPSYDGEARIKEILDLASTEKRALTKAEQEEINAIQRRW